MLSDESIDAIEKFWAVDLGCGSTGLGGGELVVTTGESKSLFIFARGDAVVAVPPQIEPARVIGPAFIGYADAGTFVAGGDTDARLLVEADAESVTQLRHACDTTEWEHGGGSNATTCVGVFRGASMATLASYEIWGERIAHISIITHPAHRRRGMARTAVSAITRIALARGLIAQYRTLVSNTASIAIARGLGFERYATTLAIRSLA